MTKVEKLKIILETAITQYEKQSPALTMLKPLLITITANLKEEEVEGLISVMKKIIEYLERED